MQNTLLFLDAVASLSLTDVCPSVRLLVTHTDLLNILSQILGLKYVTSNCALEL